MPDGSEVKAAAGYIGRFDGRALGVDACLAVMAIVSVVAIPVLHSPAALMFLVSGVLLAAFRPAKTAATLLDCRMVLILPAFCLLSTIWSLYPALSLRFSIQLTATVVIAILVARRLAFQTTILAVFLALFPFILLSVALGPYRTDTGALVGMFGSKNEMGGMSALFALIGFGLAAAPRLPGGLGLLGGGGALCAGPHVLWHGLCAEALFPEDRRSGRYRAHGGGGLYHQPHRGGVFARRPWLSVGHLAGRGVPLGVGHGGHLAGAGAFDPAPSRGRK